MQGLCKLARTLPSGSHLKAEENHKSTKNRLTPEMPKMMVFLKNQLVVILTSWSYTWGFHYISPNCCNLDGNSYEVCFGTPLKSHTGHEEFHFIDRISLYWKGSFPLKKDAPPKEHLQNWSLKHRLLEATAENCEQQHKGHEPTLKQPSDIPKLVGEDTANC